MGRLREIQRTAAFAWSTGVSQPYIATGTRAGALDADFSTESRLEIWDLKLASAGASAELQPVTSAQTDSRFFDIAWSQPTKEYPSGVIAGAFESGALCLWDAAKLISDATDAQIAKTTVHTGPIKALQFNPHRPELLASCGAKGELYITDLNNPSNPYRVGSSAARSDDFDCLDWNKRVPHILVTGSSAGFVTVWDVKKKAENLTLNNYNRKPVSAVAWHPDEPTRLATAISTDQEPLILFWQLRNTSQPEKTLKAHDQGLLSLSWCPQDSGLLLSCGKDNRNICWDTESSQVIGEFPIVTNWTFQTRFNPVHPDILATASFDGKIIIQSLQSTKTAADESAGSVNQVADGEDFFAHAQVQPTGSSFSLSHAPKWLKRPVGVSFGFGGKIVRFAPDTTTPHKSKLSISTFTADAAAAASISEFSAALKNADVAAVCQSRIEASDDETSKEDWKIMKTLMADKPRKEILTYLGFDREVLQSNDDDNNGEKAVTNGDNDEGASKDANRLSAFFDNSGDDKNFLTDLAASKGARTNNPFHIFSGSESQTDKDITRALMLGSFEGALDICIKEKRMSDAFMIAICGGQKCIDKAQAAYFAQQTGAPNYLRLLASVVGKNLWDIVYNADLENWREVMATLCTFADEKEFSDLCEALGDRLEESAAPQKDASFCFLAGSKLEKLVPIWIKEMQANEKSRSTAASDESEFAVHVQSLQSFIEKISIFRKTTNYEDRDGLEKTADWKLEPLYQRYAEYADVVASQGHLALAEHFLALLPAKYEPAEVARNRIRQATKKATVPSLQSQQRPVAQVATTAAAPSGLSAGPYGPRTNATFQPISYQPQAPLAAQSTMGSYGTTAPGITGIRASSPYVPMTPFTGTGAVPQPSASANLAPPPSGPPTQAPPASNGANWNDLPDAFQRQAPPRRSTPSVASPLPNTAANSYGFRTQSPGPPPPKPTTPAPPPRAGQPPRTASPLVDRTSYQPSQVPRPPSTNQYQPQISANSYVQSTPPASLPQRVSSPYQAPPTSSAPPTNRYQPAPGTAVSPAPGSMQFSGARPPVAPSPYGPPAGYQPSNTGPTSTAPPPPPPAAASRPPPGPPPTGPPRGASRQAAAAPAPSPAAAPAAAQYPPGDRSHIQPAAQPIYDLLNKEMQRIKGLAPATYKPQVDDTERRLNLLFDALNNGAIGTGPLDMLSQLSQAVQTRNFDQAQSLYGELIKQVESSSLWMVGVKRLISMSKATPI